MLKRIALVGMFLLASAFSISATATSQPLPVKQTIVPKAPVPQGLCPDHHC
jgi:hypothetical protein